MTDGMFSDLDAKLRDYDPPAHERIHYRRARDGQLGWLVVREGKDKIKLDRPNEDLCVAFSPDQWIPELEHRPLTRGQVAQVAYEADVKLMMMMGNFQQRKAWNLQHEDWRIAFAEKGPPANPLIRKLLFEAIMQTLERVTK